MSVLRLIKLAIKFETKLAQQKVSYQNLEKISNMLGIINEALNAKTKEDLTKYVVNMSDFGPGLNASGQGALIYDTIEGNLRGRSYMSTYNHWTFNNISKAYQSLLNIYNKLIDEKGNEINISTLRKELEPLLFIKNGQQFLTDLSIMIRVVQLTNTAEHPYPYTKTPEIVQETISAPKTWGGN